MTYEHVSSLSDVGSQMKVLTKTVDEVNEALDDLVDAWHNSPEDGTSIHDFLDMSWEEYAQWLQDPEMVPERFLEP